MGVEVADDLITGNTHRDGATDGITSNLARYHIGIASGKAGEKLQDSDLELGGCVSVDAVIGLDDDEAFSLAGAESVVEAGGYAAEGAGIGGQRRCEARWVETR